MLTRHSSLTLYQHCATLNIRRQNLLRFQSQINFIQTLTQNTETAHFIYQSKSSFGIMGAALF